MINLINFTFFILDLVCIYWLLKLFLLKDKSHSDYCNIWSYIRLAFPLKRNLDDDIYVLQFIIMAELGLKPLF